jgi:hypothetical protein
MRLKEFMTITEEYKTECGYYDFLAYHEEKTKQNNKLKGFYANITTAVSGINPLRLLSQSAKLITSRRTKADPSARTGT